MKRPLSTCLRKVQELKRELKRYRCDILGFSPDVVLCGWLGLKHQLTNQPCRSQMGRFWKNNQGWGTQDLGCGEDSKHEFRAAFIVKKVAGSITSCTSISSRQFSFRISARLYNVTVTTLRLWRRGGRTALQDSQEEFSRSWRRLECQNRPGCIPTLGRDSRKIWHWRDEGQKMETPTVRKELPLSTLSTPTSYLERQPGMPLTGRFTTRRTSSWHPNASRRASTKQTQDLFQVPTVAAIITSWLQPSSWSWSQQSSRILVVTSWRKAQIWPIQAVHAGTYFSGSAVQGKLNKLKEMIEKTGMQSNSLDIFVACVSQNPWSFRHYLRVHKPANHIINPLERGGKKVNVHPSRTK